jgi:hypothetical protein
VLLRDAPLTPAQFGRGLPAVEFVEQRSGLGHGQNVGERGGWREPSVVDLEINRGDAELWATVIEFTAETQRTRRKVGLQRVDYSPDSLPQGRNVEIYQQPQLELLEPQICEYLRRMDWQHGINRLELDNYLLANQQIHAIGAAKLAAFVLDRQQHLALKRYAAQVQLSLHAALVCRLEEARPKVPVHFDSRTNDLFAQAVRE